MSSGELRLSLLKFLVNFFHSATLCLWDINKRKDDEERQKNWEDEESKLIQFILYDGKCESDHEVRKPINHNSNRIGAASSSWSK